MSITTGIRVTGQPDIDQATAEIAVALRDAAGTAATYTPEQHYYDEAMRLRDAILKGGAAVARGGVMSGQRYADPIARQRMAANACPECGEPADAHTGWGCGGCSLTDNGVAVRIAQYQADLAPARKEGS